MPEPAEYQGPVRTQPPPRGGEASATGRLEANRDSTNSEAASAGERSTFGIARGVPDDGSYAVRDLVVCQNRYLTSLSWRRGSLTG